MTRGILRQEELNLLVGKVSQFVAEDIVDADVVCISPARARVAVSGELSTMCCGRATRDATVALGDDSRKVGDCERWIVVEVIRLEEALQQIPTHLGQRIGACVFVRRRGRGRRCLQRPQKGELVLDMDGRRVAAAWHWLSRETMPNYPSYTAGTTNFRHRLLRRGMLLQRDVSIGCSSGKSRRPSDCSCTLSAAFGPFVHPECTSTTRK